MRMLAARLCAILVDGEGDMEPARAPRGFVSRLVRRDVKSESESPRIGALKPPGLRARVARWDCRRVPVEPGVVC